MTMSTSPKRKIIGHTWKVTYTPHVQRDGLVRSMQSFSLEPIYEEPLTPCKLCGRYDDKVKEHETPTGVVMGYLHPWCASQIIHDAMRELINRMHQ